jgi:alginate O-acetyltransferase complex protein AlgI
MTEFWRRWHISLSSWFKDYLYIPLGGNRKGKLRTTINLFIVFFVTGLWHGASFNFIFWGLGHGILLFFEKIAGRKIQAKTPNRKILNFFGHIYTITAVVSLWIFFRLGMRRSYEFLRYIFALNPGNEGAAGLIMIYSDSRFVFYFIAGLVFAFPWWRKITPLYCAGIAPPRYLALIVLLVLSISTLAVNAYNPFIYFRF